jgi:hypothetical protein
LAPSRTRHHLSVCRVKKNKTEYADLTYALSAAHGRDIPRACRFPAVHLRKDFSQPQFPKRNTHREVCAKIVYTHGQPQKAANRYICLVCPNIHCVNAFTFVNCITRCVPNVLPNSPGFSNNEHKNIQGTNADTPHKHTILCNRTSSKNKHATWRYKGDLKAKSTWKVSHVLPGTGPGLNSQVLSRWSKSELSST